MCIVVVYVYALAGGSRIAMPVGKSCRRACRYLCGSWPEYKSRVRSASGRPHRQGRTMGKGVRGTPSNAINWLTNGREQHYLALLTRPRPTPPFARRTKKKWKSKKKENENKRETRHSTTYRYHVQIRAELDLEWTWSLMWSRFLSDASVWTICDSTPMCRVQLKATVF